MKKKRKTQKKQFIKGETGIKKKNEMKNLSH